MPPKYSHTLIPRTCEHITLRSNRDFVGVTKFRASGWEIIPCCSGGPTMATRALTKVEAIASTLERGDKRADGALL